MTRTSTRREFVAAAGTGALAASHVFGLADGRQILRKSVARPVVISSANGNRFKDAEGLTCVAKAFKMMMGGADALEAVVAGVNILELDPEETGVGYGGLPNSEGVVQLDASVMHGPMK